MPNVLERLAVSSALFYQPGRFFCLLRFSLQLQAKVRSVVEALGVPVEAYLACQDDYYRKVCRNELLPVAV